ncbi:MAG: GNAT family N-acetyltransferase [Thermoleophilia bacterium]|nr:GNAT family N-acetyltransferase [Thermoleophilia bacterium]
MAGDAVADHPEALRVERFRPQLRETYGRLHSERNGAGWCHCVAWWVPTWDGWGERTAAENAGLRGALCDRGEYDGLLALVGDEPAGWCQLGPRDRLAKLVAQLALEPDGAAWAVTCFLVVPAWRRRGVATALLARAVEVARDEGATHLEGYPRDGGRLADGEAWTGTTSLFASAGFACVRESGPRSVYRLRLA